MTKRLRDSVLIQWRWLFCLLAWWLLVNCALVSSAQAEAYPLQADDQRQLTIRLAGGEQRLSVAEIIATVPAAIIDIDDTVYHGQRRYWAVDLLALFNALGLSAASLAGEDELSFVCLDGYTVTARSDLLLSKQVRAYLVLASAEGTEADRIDGRWLPYQYGEQVIGFDPFYVVWQSAAGAAPADSHDYPWPYQLRAIELAVASEVASFRPSAAQPQAEAGFQLFNHYCLRCHAVDSIGGGMGPDLAAATSAAAHFPDELLLSVIRSAPQFYPQTKMPNYASVLDEQQLQGLVAFIRYLQAR
ncbi:cytochrome c [Halioxenophilus sp. WMMB6]|uniref:c-type cytochrome n=1 Tax=Halioxenophilus sp. WMMB6 TaxID=3073815 RepID=UPI00295EE996|nr:cytochrome c [Halioxenophilus sp. WMMB6]